MPILLAFVFVLARLLSLCAASEADCSVLPGSIYDEDTAFCVMPVLGTGPQVLPQMNSVLVKQFAYYVDLPQAHKLTVTYDSSEIILKFAIGRLDDRFDISNDDLPQKAPIIIPNCQKDVKKVYIFPRAAQEDHRCPFQNSTQTIQPAVLNFSITNGEECAEVPVVDFAVSMAVLNRDIYASTEQTSVRVNYLGECQTWTVEAKFFGDNGNAVAFMYANKKMGWYVITFQGTNSLHDWTQYNWNVNMVPISNKLVKTPVGRVHQGFQKAYLSLHKQIHRYLDANKGTLLRPDVRFVINGHSLGGAMAILCAIDIAQFFEAKPIELFAFGNPRVLDDESTVYFKKELIESNKIRVWRYVTYKTFSENEEPMTLADHIKKIFGDIQTYVDTVSKLPLYEMGFRHVCPPILVTNSTLTSNTFGQLHSAYVGALASSLDPEFRKSGDHLC